MNSIWASINPESLSTRASACQAPQENVGTPSAPLELAIVIPTFEERSNIRPVLDGLAAALAGIQYEVIFVDDDSGDGTADCIREIASTSHNIRVIQRVHRRGLASACLEGMMATAAPYIAVMDADLQHDERILPQMLTKLKSDRLDVVVATRNASGGGMGNFAWHRVLLSNLGRRLSKLILRTHLNDPMSGFFVVTRGYLEEVVRSTSGIGFKILLDLVASARRPLRVGEIPYTFRERMYGSSKLDVAVGLEYLQLLIDKKIGDIVPVRFLIFSIVGFVGVLLASVVLWVLVAIFDIGFLKALAITTLVAMTGNFFLNNSMTYRDRRLKGWRILAGLATFYAACSLGAVINLRIATSAKELGLTWYIAGACGLAVGAVWNYGITSFITWRRTRSFPRPNISVSSAPVTSSRSNDTALRSPAPVPSSVSLDPL
jgi:dolichol-phosphate mannosyltransferase